MSATPKLPQTYPSRPSMQGLVLLLTIGWLPVGIWVAWSLFANPAGRTAGGLGFVGVWLAVALFLAWRLDMLFAKMSVTVRGVSRNGLVRRSGIVWNGIGRVRIWAVDPGGSGAQFFRALTGVGSGEVVERNAAAGHDLLTDERARTGLIANAMLYDLRGKPCVELVNAFDWPAMQTLAAVAREHEIEVVLA